jgi:hypothetical protein
MDRKKMKEKEIEIEIEKYKELLKYIRGSIWWWCR